MKSILLSALPAATTAAHARITLEQPQALAGTSVKVVLRVGHGRKVAEDVVQITWQAVSHESWLQDEWSDEFVLRGQTPATAGPLWFKVRQGCEKDQADWSEVPAQGLSTRGLKFPGILLEALPNEPAGHVH